MKRIASLLLLLAATTSAQEQLPTFDVEGRTLVGVWHGTLAQSAFRRGFGNLTRVTPMKLGQAVVVYCRIARAQGGMQMACPQIGPMGAVTIAEGVVRYGNNRIAFEGEQPDADTLRGRFHSRSWLGLQQASPAAAEAIRVVPRADAPEGTDKASLLRRILEEGLAAVPHDAAAMKRNGSLPRLPKPGPVLAVAYLGQETKWDWPPPPGIRADIMNLPGRPDFYSVYLVRLAEGELLCGLHQREDGVLDALGCV